jgi:hypothetical protein
MASGGSSRKTALGCLILLGLMLSCGSITVVSLDVVCHGALTQRLPLYPGAEVAHERYNMIRPFGMGETYVMLRTTDASDDVRQWYARTVAAYVRDRALSGGDVGYRISSSRWQVRRSDDQGATEVVLHGTCVQ